MASSRQTAENVFTVEPILAVPADLMTETVPGFTPSSATAFSGAPVPDRTLSIDYCASSARAPRMMFSRP